MPITGEIFGVDGGLTHSFGQIPKFRFGIVKFGQTNLDMVWCQAHFDALNRPSLGVTRDCDGQTDRYYHSIRRSSMRCAAKNHASRRALGTGI